MSEIRNFTPVKRANADAKFWMINTAEKYAEENDCEFLEIIGGNGYTAHFEADGYSEFYSWFIRNIPESDTMPDYEIVFGSGQAIFNGVFTITEDNYYDYIGAGV